MNRSNAPIIANWLLKHLTRGGDELAGDLLEEFTSGRSREWYWRQVLLAILVSAAAGLRAVSLALGFALLWSIGVGVFWGPYFFPNQIASILEWAQAWYLLFPWPWSTLLETCLFAALNTTYVAAGLGTYLLLSKRFSISGFIRGAALAFVLQIPRLLAVPGLLKRSKSFSAAIVFAILTLTIWVAQKAKDHQRHQARNLIVE